MFILQGSGPLRSGPTGPGSGYSVMPPPVSITLFSNSFCLNSKWSNKTILISLFLFYCDRCESDDHCKIFGESSMKNVQRENVRHGFNSLFPCIEVNKRWKIFYDNEVKDLLVLHKSVILVKQTVTELSLHRLAINDEEWSAIPLLRMSFNDTWIDRNQFKERFDPSLLAPPQNFQCIKFICHPGATANDFTVMRIGHQLFSSLFSPTQTLQNSIILLMGDSHGKVYSFPANGIYMEAAAERRINLNTSVSDVLFDLQEPVIEITITSIGEVSFKHRGALNKSNQNVAEIESKRIQNILRNESVLVIFGRNGKLLLLLAPSKSYESLSFNQDHIAGPITSVLAKEDTIICSNWETINLYRLSIEAVSEEGKKIFAVPFFEPLHRISCMAVVSIADRIIVPGQKNAQRAFFCTDNEGCLCDVVIQEDGKKHASTCGHSEKDMRHLIESLRTSVHSLATSEDALEMQSSTLRHLQIRSNFIAETVNAYIEDASKKSDLATSRDMQSYLTGRITSVALESNGNLLGSIELHNNTNYPLLGSSLFLVNFISISKFHNSSFGQRIVVSRPYLICDLQPKSSKTYKLSVECREGISNFPMTVDFKLVMKFPGSAGASALQTGRAKCLAVTLNTCRITVLDVARPVNDNASMNIPNIHSTSYLHRNTSKYSSDSLRPLKEPYCPLAKTSPKQATKQSMYSISMIIPPVMGNKTMDKDSSQFKTLHEFFSTICPEMPVAKSVLSTDQLHIQLASMHRVKVSRHSRSILLEGDHLALLLQIQEALCYRIEVRLKNFLRICPLLSVLFSLEFKFYLKAKDQVFFSSFSHFNEH